MKIIFLDVDGVLNNSDTRTVTRDGWCFVDDRLVCNLACIVHATGAKVVLSSTWRDDWHREDETLNTLAFEDLRNKLREFKVEIMSKTGAWRKCRGLEIQEWLDNWKGEEIENFIILDDWNDMEPVKDYLFWINPTFGLTDSDVSLAILYLNES